MLERSKLDLIALAETNFFSDRFEDAKKILLEILSADSLDTKANELLAYIYAKNNDLKKALLYLERSALHQDCSFSALYELSMLYQREDSRRMAFDCLDRAILKKPAHLSLYELGLLYAHSGALDLALITFEKNLFLNNNCCDTLFNIGLIFDSKKDISLAIENYKKSLKINRCHVSALINLAIILKNHSKPLLALKLLNHAIAAQPWNPEIWQYRAITLYALHRYQESIAACDKALELNQEYAEALHSKGIALIKIAKREDALVCLQNAIELKPDFEQAWLSIGLLLYDLRCYQDAIIACDKALNLNQTYAEAWHGKGIILSELRRYDEAIDHYDQALMLKPDLEWVFGDYFHSKMKIGLWDNFSEELKKLFDKISLREKVTAPFSLLSLLDEPFIQKKCAEIFINKNFPHNNYLGAIPKRDKPQKIRIGYFSSDFQSHPVAFLSSELFEIQSRDEFELFAFSLRRGNPNDPYTLRLKNAFDNFLDVENLSDLDIAKLAREHQIDIAVDLSGHTQFSRTGIFSYRAAPIQVNWLGYAGTIGASYIDYIVADSTVIPEHNRQFFTEKIVYMPDTYMVDDSKRVASPFKFTKLECGLPEDAFIFCCFNVNYKFNPIVLDSWSKILGRVNKSVLWISENNPQFNANLLAEFEKRGINRRRIVFAKRVVLMTDHLARYSLASLFLDTFPYNAHTTAVDALKSGVPVITYIGNTYASRACTSLLNSLGLPELATHSYADYENLAVDYANNPEKLNILKENLQEKILSMPLFNTKLFTKNLESAYRQMYERYQSNLTPDHIFVNLSVI